MGTAVRKAGGPKPRWGAQCFHCWICVPGESTSEGMILVKCAHCPQIKSKYPLDDPDMLVRHCEDTRRGHARLCKRSVHNGPFPRK